MIHVLSILIFINLLAILWIATHRWAGYYEDMRFAFATLTLLFFAAFLGLPIYLVGSSITILAGIYAFNRLNERGLIERVLGFLTIGITLSFLAGVSVIESLGAVPDYAFILFLVIIGTVTGLLIYLISEDVVFTLVGSCMLMWSFIFFGIKVDILHILFAFIFSLFLGLVSYRERSIEITGVVGGTILGMLIIIFGDIRWFLIIFIFSMLGSLFTRYKYTTKVGAG
ncbi:MAG: DUF92 domain-containing protein, partial [Candidatus Syntropharchaeales archaeon]